MQADLPIATVFLSHLPWEEVRAGVGSAVDPYLITVSPLTSAGKTLNDLATLLVLIFFLFSDIITTMEARFIASQDDTSINAFHPILQPIYRNFAEFTTAICTQYTVDPSEMAYVAAAQWPLYISPLLNDWNTANDNEEAYDIPIIAPSRLNSYWRQSIATAVQNLYPRTVNAVEWASSTKTTHLSLSQIIGQNIPINPPTPTTSGSGSLNQLPRMARFLLVAAYICSYNPTRADEYIISRLRDDRGGKVRKGQGGRTVKAGTVAKVSLTIQYLSSVYRSC